MEASTVRHGAMFDTNELVLNMGPQHPSTHGVLRVVLRLDGEKVVDADVVIGYLHRGIEKLSENRNWTQIILLTDRMDYVAAATSNVGYCQTVEKLMQIEVPRRARYVRTILCELQRIASHCLWVGTHAINRKSTRLNSSHTVISYAVFCLKKKTKKTVIVLYIEEKLRKIEKGN